MITFDQARALAYQANHQLWESNGNPGEYYVDPYGFEDRYFYLMVDGARETLEEPDFDFMLMGWPLTLVAKFSGETYQVGTLTIQGHVDRMMQVGQVPAEVYDICLDRPYCSPAFDDGFSIPTGVRDLQNQEPVYLDARILDIFQIPACKSR